MSDELFKVEVNEEGLQVFRRLSALSLIILMVTVLMGALQIGTVLYFLLKSVNFSRLGNRFNYQYYTSVLSVVVGFVLQVVQIVLYRRFIRLAIVAINNSDSVGFNRSLRLLYMQAVLYLLQSGLVFLIMAARFLL